MVAGGDFLWEQVTHAAGGAVVGLHEVCPSHLSGMGVSLESTALMLEGSVSEADTAFGGGAIRSEDLVGMLGAARCLELGLGLDGVVPVVGVNHLELVWHHPVNVSWSCSGAEVAE